MKRHTRNFFSIVLSAMILNSPVSKYTCYSVHDIPENNTVYAADTQNTDIILENVLSKMAETVSEPSFGTNFGEWSVLCLARGGYYSIDDRYFSDYYNRIVETVNTTASKVNKNGALHKVKSTENSRLILALSSIGKNAENVGNWNLITPYNDFDWIKKQGINGPIFTIIALDTMDYETEDPTIRQQCLDYILEHQLDDGGWALTGSQSDPDITAMTLQALARYTENQQIAEAIEKALDCLSMLQLDNGGYDSWGSINSESIAQVITACTALGIDPDTDERFVKNGCSAVDAILEFYNPDSMDFSHIIGDGGNAMATDQASYALIAYQRFLNGRNSLYDMRDVSENDYQNTFTTTGTESTTESTSTFTEPVTEATQITENEDVTENNYTPKTKVTESTTPVITSKNTSPVKIKYTSSTTATSKATTTNTSTTATTSQTTTTTTIPSNNKISFRAINLYTGDNVDIIQSSQMAVAVAVSDIPEGAELKYNDGNYTTDFLYNKAMSDKTEMSVYIALVNSDIDMESFTKADNYSINNKVSGDTVVFGDVNNDGIINAQDAMDILSIWTKKNNITDEKQILTLNVNGDNRINNLDAIEISEAFVNGKDFGVMEKIGLLSEENK